MNKKHSRKKTNIGKYTILAIVIVIAIFTLAHYAYQPPSIQTNSNGNFSINVTSPENKTYNTNNITLTVVANDYATEIIDSFDRVSNISECSDCISFTRFNLIYTNGVHTITVYATKGNQSISKTVVFNINV